MKTLIPVLLFAVASSTASAAITYGQFFNNNNPTFIDSQSGLYNWNYATANNIATAANDISAGNTSPTGLPGEVTLGRGFFFLVPQVSTEGAGATFMYTTHTGISTELQNNPQPDWYRDGAYGTLAGTTLGDVSNILFRSNSGASNSYQARIGIQVNGNWYLSNTAFTLTTTFTEFNLPNLASETWIVGAFDGVNLDADVSDNSTTSLEASDVVTGYGMYADVEAFVGNNSRIRMDRMVLTVTTPAPTPIVIPVPSIVVTSGTDAEVSFQSETGLSYQLQKTTVPLETVTEPDWVDVGGATVAGDGTVKTLIDSATLPGTTEAFYRVVVTN